MFKVEQHTPKSLRWWYEQYLSQRVNMAPSYQRRSHIWSPWKRAHLIDSLLNDFDVPKFYVANLAATSNSKINESSQAFALIDGKQRLGAIFEYFQDVFALNKTAVVYDAPQLAVAGLKFSALKTKFPHLARKIEEYVPTVMNVLTNDAHKIEELFVRLNMGEATTGAERRNAMGGPIPEITRELAMHPFFMNRIRFATRRMQDYNLITKLLLLETRGHFVDTKRESLDKLVVEAIDWQVALENPERQEIEGPYASARDRIVRVLDSLNAEFEDDDKLLNSPGNIPIYYWFARENPTRVNELRDFVLSLTHEVKEATVSQKEQPGSGNPELLAYYTMSRTTNDQESLEGRYRIFVRRFSKFRRVPRR